MQSGCPSPEDILHCIVPVTHFTLTPKNVQQDLNEPTHGIMESLYIPRQQVLIIHSFEEGKISNTEQFCLFQLQERQSRWSLRKTREPQFTLKKTREHKMLFLLPLSMQTSPSKSTGTNHRAGDTKKAYLGNALTTAFWTFWIEFLALPESGVATWYSTIRKKTQNTHICGFGLAPQQSKLGPEYIKWGGGGGV